MHINPLYLLILKVSSKGGITLNDESIRETADMLSANSFKVDTMINLLLEKNIISKEEFNQMLDKTLSKAEEEPTVDDYVLEEMKKKIHLT